MHENDDVLVCRTHGYSRHDAGSPPDPLACELIPIGMLAGVAIRYQVGCAVCGELEAGLHDTMGSALLDRDAHLRSHMSGLYEQPA